LWPAAKEHPIGALLVTAMLVSALSITFTSATASTYKIQREPNLQARLEQELQKKGKHYQPRSRHMAADGKPLYTNRLILEASPYLLQHAHNPVDWHPWGAEALAEAKRQNKPIFLSIGYSTCHWCHVMEEESFESLAVARLLNKYFIPVKVDRELRPDVDATYLLAVKLLAGRGGWPLSVFLTPNGKPFQGGVYYPEQEFTQLLQRTQNLWRTDQQAFVSQGERIANEVAKLTTTHGRTAPIDQQVIYAAIDRIMARYDSLQGGFSEAPKFTNESLLQLLLKHLERNSDQDNNQRVNNSILKALQGTLSAMAHGGIYDQIGGGFHRYSIDNSWLVPHFEKMLHNQALLSRIYLRAWQLTGKQLFSRIARQSMDYVLRDLSDNDGGFYSAYDADSEGVEGLYYLWTPQQIKSALSASDARLALSIYDIDAAGDFAGRNIVHLPQSLSEYATEHNTRPGKLLATLTRINQRLLKKRLRRVAPQRDDKIITAWNGMMIGTLALAGEVLDDQAYTKAARRAAEFVWRKNRNQKGELMRANLRGHANVIATQEDYAWLADAMLALYDSSGEQLWLRRARSLTDKMIKRFWDRQNGGFFMSGAHSRIAAIARGKSFYDDATPSGNAIALGVLQKLSRRSDKPGYDQYAQRMLSSMGSALRQKPERMSALLGAASDLWHGETGYIQYAARGAVRVRASIKKQQLDLQLLIKPGWHINSHRPLQEYLIATSLRLEDNSEWKLGQTSYPPAIVRTLGFQNTPLSLFEGKAGIKADIVVAEPVHSKHATNGKSANNAAPNAIVLVLRLQACNDKACLPPEELRLLPLLR